MIIGIGIDIVELTRIQKVFESNGGSFCNRILTANELAKLNDLPSDKRKVEYLAGRFAVKEAIAKAFGTGIGEISFHDIEIINDDTGKPAATLIGGAKKIALEIGATNVWISISHSSDNAIAQAILEKL